MIIDFRGSGAADLDTSAAVVVVGAGAAGIALARALDARGVRAVLVESGGDPRDPAGVAASSRLNEGEVHGQDYRGLTEARARVTGGATQLWHGQCVRLHPEDVATRAWVPGSGWPLPFAELERWYPAAEAFFGLSGRGYGPQRWAEHPSLAPLAWDERHLLHDFTEYTPTPHLGTRYRSALARSASITVLEHATAVRVLLDGDHARGVEVVAPDGRRQELAARDVVLAAGALENARTLMMSDPGGVGLGTGAEHTGRWLADHAVVTTAELHPHPGQDLQDLAALQDRYSPLHRGRRRIYPKVRLAPAAQAGGGLVSANAVFVFDHDDDPMDPARRVLRALRGRAVDAAVLRDAAASLAAVRPLLRTAHRRWVRGLSSGTPASRVSLQVWLEQVPDRDSRVLLSPRRDALGLPRAVVDWRVGEVEARTSRELTRAVAADLHRLGAARAVELDVMTDDAAWRARVTDAWHPSGTTRMSGDPRGGVVDADGAVHGVAGLHVAGASTFPVAGYANPTLTVVALALRLADRLAGARAHEGAGTAGASGGAATVTAAGADDQVTAA